MKITIRPHPYLAIMVPVVAFLSLLGAAGLYSRFALGHDSVYGLVQMFLLNYEGNIPTFVSSTNLTLCGLLLLVIAACTRQAGQRFSLAWGLLGLLALFLAVDEAAQIHELLDRHEQWIHGLFKATGVLTGPWVVVYGGLVIAVVIGFAGFFWHLPRKYQWLFAISAFVYVGAAIGLEMLAAQIWDENHNDLIFECTAWVEEVLEMSAVVFLNFSLLSYLEQIHGPLTIGTSDVSDTN